MYICPHGEETMKKIILTAIAAVMLTASLTACGSTFTCEMCGEEKTGKSYTFQSSATGEDMTICEDCYNLVKDVMNAVN